MVKDICEAVDDLCNNIQSLAPSIDWMVGEIKRLRAENMELQLQRDNLTYMIRRLTQGEVLQ